ncbi:tyrosine-type recombinase/integrase [Bradyrhizobium sp. DASA03076]|uniref:tyrosine-type recombinase/integrase n=1 Tax=Bradyrhizobium sp. BLXBL-03 TaxID=3395916 RepID=UPI003F6F8A0C
MFDGTKDEAEAKLRDIFTSADKGTFVAPTDKTVGGWIDYWLKIGAPGSRRNKPVSPRTLERYSQLLRTHVKPSLDKIQLQKLTARRISELYAELQTKDIAPRTLVHVHVVFGAALGAAVRSKELSVSPMAHLLNAPTADEADHGIALDEAQMKKLVEGFRRSALFLIVAIAAYTGMRRNEILALRWNDLDVTDRTLRIRRALEQTKGHIGFKPPKTKRGIRDIDIEQRLVDLLIAERERYLRLKAGIVDNSAQVDLSLLKLPEEALIFPSFAGPKSDFTRPRDPRAVTRAFTKLADKVGFPGLRFHDLRGSHGTQLLRRGVPVDVVARRLGHDPYTLLKSYAKEIATDKDRITKELTGMVSL